MPKWNKTRHFKNVVRWRGSYGGPMIVKSVIGTIFVATAIATFAMAQTAMPPRIQAGLDRGEVEASFPLNDIVVTLKPSAAQQADLESLLASQQDPASPDFHNWLTPQQYADRFGLSARDFARITDWLRSSGFVIRHVAASRNWIAASGTAAAAKSLLGVEIHHYTVAGEPHFSPTRKPNVPGDLAGLIAGIRGLDDFLPRAPHGNVHAAFTAGSGEHYLAPGDVATIYNINPLYQNGYDGTGQNLAIVGQSAVNLSDIDNFRSIFGLAKNDPKLVTVPNMTVPGIVQGDVVESDLDLEWAGAVAKNANIIFIYSGNVFNSLQYAVAQDLAPVISISYGTCEEGGAAEGAALRTIAQQANAEGITLLSASGDSGAFSCDSSSSAQASNGLSVSLPASIPEVTAVGGTGFNEGTGTYWSATNSATESSALSYIPEVGWDESSSGGGIGAGGGGASVLFTKPVWQAGAGVPADGARDVPDVAMAAGADHDGAIVCTGGGCANGLYATRASVGASVVGGTSLAAPLFAGITTLVNHYQVKSGTLSKAGLGNINSVLYPLAQAYGGIFHDITGGSNVVPCKAGSSGCPTGSFGYQAGPGYDRVTGLGSVNANALATGWSLLKSAPAALSAVAASPSAVTSGATVTVTATLTAAAPAAGIVVTLAGGAAAFVLPARISIPAGQLSASVAVTAGTVAVSTPVTITATYNGATESTTVTIAPLVVPALTSVSVSPAGVPGGSSATLTVTLSAAVPTSASASGVTVTLSSSNPAFPVPASVVVPAGSKTASLTVEASAVNIAASATITAKYNGAIETTSVAITPVALPSLSSVSIAPSNLPGGTQTGLTIQLSAVAPAGGSVVTLSSNNTAFPVPGSVTVLAGSKQISLNIVTASVKTQTTVTVTAGYRGVSMAASATLTPIPIPTLTALSVNPGSVKGGSNVSINVTLSGPAPPAGTPITFTSSNSSALVLPPTVEMPSLGVAGSLNVKTGRVSVSTTVTITAGSGGTTQTTKLTITP